jgi:pyruvate/2-oxoglutarate dehydrogenase complex dihydrolipoamide acyltransferase (E2) component
MATSAEKLSKMIDVLAEEFDFDSNEAITFLASKGILPKKLIPSPPATPKKVSLFASKQAKEFAEENGINTEGIVGSGVGGKLTLSDVKGYMTPPPKKSKLNASPHAVKFAIENDIKLDGRVGSGSDEKILLDDVKKWLSESFQSSDEDDDE